MSIKVYQSKQGKKLYEVYVGIKARGRLLQKRRRKDFQGNFIVSLPTARRVEFELKRGVSTGLLSGNWNPGYKIP